MHVEVSGRVQGAGFRYSTERQARRLGLSGWVRNREDGDVEVLAEGDEANLIRLLDWCRHGPPGARVTSVRQSWSEATGEFAGFGTRS
jgi:acylphosphatase